MSSDPYPHLLLAAEAAPQLEVRREFGRRRLGRAPVHRLRHGRPALGEG